MPALVPVRCLLQSNPAVRNIYQQVVNSSVISVSRRHKHEPNASRTYVTHAVNKKVYGYNRQCSKCGHLWSFQANISSTAQARSKRLVLGIETSCDDTGAAIVDEEGNIIAEALHSQTTVHNETGGIIPNIAKELHQQNVESVVQQTLQSANMQVQDVDAIAVTVKPGLVMSLRVGLRHAQKLAHLSNQQLIPIHHMEAHALTARMINRIDFPFLVLLASGGHCLLAVARGIDDFLLLGSSLDSAPGEAYDKTARELNLYHLPQFAGMSGGRAVELMAENGDPTAFPLVHVMSNRASCNFSFSGVKITAKRQILEEYTRLGLPDDAVLPNVADICAWFQYNVVYHLGRRLQRAFVFADNQELIGDSKTLVVSGGVASNAYVRANLQHICSSYNYNLVCPPPKLCTDNGIMIAWSVLVFCFTSWSPWQSAQVVCLMLRRLWVQFWATSFGSRVHFSLRLLGFVTGAMEFGLCAMLSAGRPVERDRAI